jgi:hypothetical protein
MFARGPISLHTDMVYLSGINKVHCPGLSVLFNNILERYLFILRKHKDQQSLVLYICYPSAQDVEEGKLRV